MLNSVSYIATFNHTRLVRCLSPVDIGLYTLCDFEDLGSAKHSQSWDSTQTPLVF